MAFCSSRTLPGHRCRQRAESASGARMARVPASAVRRLQNVMRQQRDVFDPVAQRREHEPDDREPEPEVVAKAPRAAASASGWLVAAITRASTARGVFSPSRRISRSCSTRSSFACARGDSSLDLVQKERALVRVLEQARAGANRAGERAPGVAE